MPLFVAAARIEDHFSGRDPATFPGVPGDGGPHVSYSEGRLLGYKYYNTDKGAAQPAYYFGQGLGGYTTFKTELLHIDGQSTFHGQADRPSPTLQVKVKSTNTGARTGKEVAQVYVRAHRPAPGADVLFQKVRGEAAERSSVVLIRRLLLARCFFPLPFAAGSVHRAVHSPLSRSLQLLERRKAVLVRRCGHVRHCLGHIGRSKGRCWSGNALDPYWVDLDGHWCMRCGKQTQQDMHGRAWQCGSQFRYWHGMHMHVSMDAMA